MMQQLLEQFPEEWFDTYFLAMQPFTFPNTGGFSATLNAIYTCQCRAQVHADIDVQSTSGGFMILIGGAVGFALCRTLYDSEIVISA